MKALVVILRGLPASAIGPYGNRWVETPNLDALAAQGVVFDWHFAAHPDAHAARQVWRSGCHSFPHPGAEEAPVRPGPDLLTILKERGVTTRLIVDDSHPAQEEFAAGWEHVVVEPDPEAIVEVARRTLEELAGVPSWLLWVELGTLLPPWWAPAEVVDAYFATEVEEEDEDEEEEENAGAEYLAEEERLEPLFDPPEGVIDRQDDGLYLRIQKTFAATMTTVDEVVGHLLDGLPDDVFLMVTSDHGQALGEQGVIGPMRAWLNDEVVRVPLLLSGPGCHAGRHVAALTLSIDVAPTLAALAGAELPGTHGQNLIPLAGVEERPGREYACMGLRIEEEIEWALRSANWLLRVPIAGPDEGRPRLFAKPEDRCEVNDVLQHHLEDAEALEQALRAYVQQHSWPQEAPAG